MEYNIYNIQLLFYIQLVGLLVKYNYKKKIKYIFYIQLIFYFMRVALGRIAWGGVVLIYIFVVFRWLFAFLYFFLKCIYYILLFYNTLFFFYFQFFSVCILAICFYIHIYLCAVYQIRGSISSMCKQKNLCARIFLFCSTQL